MWVKDDSIIDLKVVLCSNSDKNKVILYPLFDHQVVTTKKTSYNNICAFQSIQGLTNR